MKRGTPRHPKLADLAARLGVPKYSAGGLLEFLWHFTAEFAPAGDIGKFSDDAICAAVCWDGASIKLVSCLLESRWLDACSCHRLRIHDWPNHADQTVQRVLSKRDQGFLSCYDDPSTVLASGEHGTSQPLPLPLPKANSQEPEYRKRNAVTQSHNAVTALLPSASASVSGSVDGEGVQRENPEDTTEAQAEQIYRAYPKKVGKPVAIRSIIKAVKLHGFEHVLGRTNSYAAARTGEDPNFTPNPSTWFNQQRYNDDPSTWKNASHASQTGCNGKPESSAVQTISHHKELERVEAAIKAISDQASHDAMGPMYDEFDRDKLRELKKRKQELITALGMIA